MLDVALSWARRGFDIFPVIPGGKMPAIPQNLVRATRDEGQIREWFLGSDYNVGIATRRYGDRYLMVVDVDTKRGVDGYKALDGLQLVNGDLPGTLRVSTPSGGVHLIYAADRPVATSAGRLARGLDVRGDGGYVVAGGSVVEGGAYHELGGEVADAPAWLVDKAGRPAPRTKADGNVIALLDTEPAMQQARQWLVDVAPVAVEGEGGDGTTYSVAAAVKDFGLSELSCLELLVDHWNDRCAPPWDYEALAKKVSNAYSYGKGGIGSRAPEAAFGEVQAADLALIPTPAPVARPKLFFQLWDEVEPDLTRVALIDGYLDQGEMSVLYGQSNVGKTFVALSACYSIATGEPWNGNKVVRGGVVYVAAEGAGSVSKRIKALKQRHGAAGLPLALVPCSVDLLRADGDTAALVAIIKEAGAAMGVDVVLVVIDTLSRAMAGGNENAPEDMTAFVGNVDRIRVGTGAHVMIVHHSGKDEAKGARGHSSLRAATDTEIEVGENEIRTRKQRDMEQGAPVPFKLDTVEIGTRPDGKVVTSAIAELGKRPDGVENPFDGAPKITAGETLALDALSEAAAHKAENGDFSGQVKINEWVEAYRLIKINGGGVPSSYDFARNLGLHRRHLARKEMVREMSPGVWIRLEKHGFTPEGNEGKREGNGPYFPGSA